MNIKLVSVFAVIAIGVGVYGVIGQKQPQPHPETQVKEEKKLTVYLTKSDLKKGHVLTRSDVYLEKWPESKANKYGLDDNLVVNFSGRPLVRRDINSDKLLYRDSLIYQQDPEYVDFVVKPGLIPFPIETNSDAIVGGVIHANSKVDILALASTSQNLANDHSVNTYKGVSLTPVLMNIKVLKLTTEKVKNKDQRVNHEKTALILELTPKEVATLTIAKRIAQIEVHLAVKNATAKQLSANAGDVLESYHAVTEFRAASAIVK
ncbi:Flp pilus assembly protein CpaB [Vibrio sp. CAIM 722]|uniref:Flp pilus assembly protein CpaB n=1 Tax=Vibrio eleionomae TaxID=2653505 RepID=A0A7X4LQ89_9VIBR|nr:Flp pilus assembly protein CpaB [Vibrio eleionomae]MZI96011.1 Flp pilus assembly protein CpaB [Vibrio eleionomae]